MTSWKLNLCKLHNEVFKAAESRINTECLPLVGGDVSDALSEITYYTWFAPRRRGCFRIPGADAEKDCICPS